MHFFSRERLLPERVKAGAATMLGGVSLLGVLLLPSVGTTVEADPACLRPARAIAHGSVEERQKELRSWSENVAGFARRCGAELHEAFTSPARRFTSKSQRELTDSEEDLFAEVLLGLPDHAAIQTLPHLDISRLSEARRRSLLRFFTGLPQIDAIPATFHLLHAVPTPVERTAAAKEIESWRIGWETKRITDAVEVEQGYRKLGFPRLYDDTDANTLWMLGGKHVDARKAESAVLMGNDAEAFELYANLARNDKNYLVHTAILADRLFVVGKLEPLRLTHLGIHYRRCGATYRTQWTAGTLFDARQNSKESEIMAESHFRAIGFCHSMLSEFEQEKERHRALLEAERRWPKASATGRMRLRLAQYFADTADKVSARGQLIESLALREQAWRLVGSPGAYRHPGGPNQARRLRERLAPLLSHAVTEGAEH